MGRVRLEPSIEFTLRARTNYLYDSQKKGLPQNGVYRQHPREDLIVYPLLLHCLPAIPTTHTSFLGVVLMKFLAFRGLY